ncbi:hypothetical protein [Bifidobacterium sp. ESL0790]|uniref:hypothetical protein n=1 Tax=Bifidobacterium sp. ESL0790 TaxID=2983233 RepID=UPI0023F89407|nr:hypothetical protein [Bifidobacterium sp. ESL0790]WEV72474.1 hypothetical protein OZY47_00305 [Bifidobacterium sp. ESL0790]
MDVLDVGTHGRFSANGADGWVPSAIKETAESAVLIWDSLFRDYLLSISRKNEAQMQFAIAKSMVSNAQRIMNQPMNDPRIPYSKTACKRAQRRQQDIAGRQRRQRWPEMGSAALPVNRICDVMVVMVTVVARKRKFSVAS